MNTDKGYEKWEEVTKNILRKLAEKSDFNVLRGTEANKIYVDVLRDQEVYWSQNST